MHVIGTAGHVDHGKSTLVAALTGIHPDRLKEEQEREMTIDLGFAWLTLLNGEDVGIVDVPGHRDFVENMLAGVGGIDAALFVVAADEGVMPQTREHLAILDILQVDKAVIALTKCDLAEDDEWLDLIEADLREVVAGTCLENAPLVRVSARNAMGIEQLKQTLMDLLQNTPVRPDLGKPRLGVDRVFTIAGFGTVVTGTLLDGSLRTGEEIEILPSGLRGRVRGLQTHKQKEDKAVPGGRTAVNISGVQVEQIQRGNVVAHPGAYFNTTRLDVSFTLNKDASMPLNHNSEVKFFVGASEVLARARVLGVEQIVPGEEGWLQLELRDPVVVVRGDRYILRRPSPGETLGGGTVVDAAPKKRHKRFDPLVIERLNTLRTGSPGEILFQAALSTGTASIGEIILKARLDKTTAWPALEELVTNGQVILLEDSDTQLVSDALSAAKPIWERETMRMVEELSTYHRTYPLRQGMPREALKSRLKINQRQFLALYRRWIKLDLLKEKGTFVYLPNHKIVYSAQQQTRVNELLHQFASSPYSPPSQKDCLLQVGEEIYNALIEQDTLVAVSNEVVFRSQDYHSMLSVVQGMIKIEGSISVAQFRDQFQTSRKYALAFLEHLDAINVTIRDGDVRRLANP